MPRCDEAQISINAKSSKARPYAAYLDQHLKFIFRATQGGERPDALQISPELRTRAIAELKALEATIPGVSNGKTVLAMAAWFFLLCFVDDIVEKMPPKAAQVALQKGIQAMGRPDLLVRGGRRKVSASSQAECVGEENTEGVEGYQMVIHACKIFGHHINELLQKSTHKKLIRSISEVFEGMVEEIDFRERRMPDVGLYLAIRVRTIGLSPFFTLLAEQLIGESSARDERRSALEMCVKVAVGMQNDIIGLDRDRSVGEWLNFAVIAAMDHISITDTEDGVLRCVETHNCAVRLALHSWSLLTSSADEGERVYAVQLLRFVHAHFKWAVAAQRYRQEAPR
jgi:hypothetical protein